MSREEILREALTEEKEFHEEILERTDATLQDKLEAKRCIEDINCKLYALNYNTSSKEK